MNGAVPEYPLTGQQLRRLAILDWIYTAANHEPHVDVSLAPLFEDQPSRERQLGLHAELVDLGTRGWIGHLVTPLGFEGYSCCLTADGVEYIEQIHQLRGDSVERRKASRDVVLRGLYDQKHDRGPKPTTFYGEPFSEADRQAALSWLRDRGYVSGLVAANGDVHGAEITADGEDLVEQDGSVNHGIDRPRDVAPASVTVTVTGDNNTIQAASPGASQSVSISVDTQQRVLTLVKAFEDALPLLQLAPDQQENTQVALAGLRAEASAPSAPRQRVRAALQHLATALGTSTATGVGTLLSNELGQLIEKL